MEWWNWSEGEEKLILLHRGDFLIYESCFLHFFIYRQMQFHFQQLHSLNSIESLLEDFIFHLSRLLRTCPLTPLYKKRSCIAAKKLWILLKINIRPPSPFQQLPASRFHFKSVTHKIPFTPETREMKEQQKHPKIASVDVFKKINNFRTLLLVSFLRRSLVSDRVRSIRYICHLSPKSFLSMTIENGISTRFDLFSLISKCIMLKGLKEKSLARELKSNFFAVWCDETSELMVNGGESSVGRYPHAVDVD